MSDEKLCEVCHGLGTNDCPDDCDGGRGDDREECPTCGGFGEIDCEECDAIGRVPIPASAPIPEAREGE